MNALPRRLSGWLLALLVIVMPALAEEPAEAPEDIPLFSQAELDQMLAPVALYPDQLLSQLLMAATYPLEIVQAARWSRAHPELKGQEAVRAVEQEDWDPSVKAMVAFPDILRRMDEDLEWTQSLGDAFLAQQPQVMETVQALRARAEEEGNLQSDEHVEVVREQRTIIVRDRYPDVVYVPWYSPYEVYGTWWWPSYRPVYWDPWPGYYRSSYFYYGPTIVIGHGFYYGYCDWHARRIHVVDAPPFYYRRPRPPNGWWAHEYNHRRGVPYRHREVHDRYAGHDAHPPRAERPDRRGRGLDTVTPVGYQPPAQPGIPPIPEQRPGDRIGPNGEPIDDRDHGAGGRPGRGAGRGEVPPDAIPRATPDVTPIVSPPGQQPGASAGGVKVRPSRPSDLRPAQPREAIPEPAPVPTPIVAPSGQEPGVSAGGVKVRPSRPSDLQPAPQRDAVPEPPARPQAPVQEAPAPVAEPRPIIVPSAPAAEQPRIVRPVQRSDVPRTAPAQPTYTAPSPAPSVEPRAPRPERTQREPRPERSPRENTQPRMEPAPYQAPPQRSFDAPQRSYQAPQRSYEAPSQPRFDPAPPPRSESSRPPRAQRESGQPRGERQREPRDDQARRESPRHQRIAQRE